MRTSVYYLLKIKNGEGRKDHIKILGQANFIRIQIKRKTAILTKCVILQVFTILELHRKYRMHISLEFLVSENQDLSSSFFQ